MAHSTNLELFIRATAKVVSKEWAWNDFDPPFKFFLQVSQRNVNPHSPYRKPHLADSVCYDPSSSGDIEAGEQDVCRRARKPRMNSARGSLHSKSNQSLKGRNDSIASQRSNARERAAQRHHLEAIERDIYYPQGECKDAIQRGLRIDHEAIKADVPPAKVGRRLKLKKVIGLLLKSPQQMISRSWKRLTQHSKAQDTFDADSHSLERLDRPDTTPEIDPWEIVPWNRPGWRRVLQYVSGSSVEEILDAENSERHPPPEERPPPVENSPPPSEESFLILARDVDDSEPYQEPYRKYWYLRPHRFPLRSISSQSHRAITFAQCSSVLILPIRQLLFHTDLKHTRTLESYRHWIADTRVWYADVDEVDVLSSEAVGCPQRTSMCGTQVAAASTWDQRRSSCTWFNDGNSLALSSTVADDLTSSLTSSSTPSPSREEATSKQSVRNQHQNEITQNGSFPRSHRLRLLWTRLAPRFIIRGRSDADEKEIEEPVTPYQTTSEPRVGSPGPGLLEPDAGPSTQKTTLERPDATFDAQNARIRQSISYVSVFGSTSESENSYTEANTRRVARTQARIDRYDARVQEQTASQDPKAGEPSSGPHHPLTPPLPTPSPSTPSPPINPPHRLPHNTENAHISTIPRPLSISPRSAGGNGASRVVSSERAALAQVDSGVGVGGGGLAVQGSESEGARENVHVALPLEMVLQAPDLGESWDSIRDWVLGAGNG
ncbi:hypothetical protein IQ07DRAFT_680320 [Pyrenochaeta sp. DS3sAY3a]|nr:hypothetical protein IQ07DRAFT_680320 [Pyrenochaeta sp. DS3sAY3a]